MIHTRGLAHLYRSGRGRNRREVRAVDGVDLDVRPGEIVGLLGPNGAGKTTTMRMLTTSLRPTGGTAVVAGHDVVREPAQIRRRIGYVSQSGGVSSMARAGHEVVDRGLLYGGRSRDVEPRARRLFAELDIEGLWDRTPREMSGGQRRRLDLAMGLIHRPDLVLLDEPTSGLDPQSRANLWQHVRRLRAEHETTVLLTTHYLDEADALCDRIVVVDAGHVIADDTPDALKASVAGDLVDVGVLDPRDADRAAAVLAAAGPLHGATVEVDGARVRRRIPRAATEIPGITRALQDHGIVLASLEVRRPTLEDVFLSLTGRSLREDGAQPLAVEPEPVGVSS
ncbi:ATP-binding cassette domain-containing protein [Nocardioides plantarum]|uniref:ATP-binding cassette domain-containing protein n=1 Tax=Nocardioides plantarum TaxID=29299 RepID=A0ABV5K4H0_9ACTN|nr:ATP-binding cassette domain-containing protein [Nocardioides plantarum]